MHDDSDGIRRVSLHFLPKLLEDKGFDSIIKELIESPLELKQISNWMTVALAMKESEDKAGEEYETQRSTLSEIVTDLTAVRVRCGGSIGGGILFFEFEPRT